jgi:hypothetical protein
MNSIQNKLGPLQDEWNIVFTRKSWRTSRHGNKNVKTSNDHLICIFVPSIFFEILHSYAKLQPKLTTIFYF